MVYFQIEKQGWLQRIKLPDGDKLYRIRVLFRPWQDRRNAFDR